MTFSSVRLRVAMTFVLGLAVQVRLGATRSVGPPSNEDRYPSRNVSVRLDGFVPIPWERRPGGKEGRRKIPIRWPKRYDTLEGGEGAVEGAKGGGRDGTSG